MGSTAEPTFGKDREDAFHKHMSGDKHSARGLHYECALRCLWLLDLRGTKNRLALAEGEDAKILLPDGKVTYRQAKKKEGGHWAYDKSLQAFVARAYKRFSADPSVRHEFYTNQAIPSGASGLLDRHHLNAAHNGVCKSAPIQTEEFCKSVRLFPERYQPEPSLMLLVVKERLRDVIDSAYPGCQARNFVNDQEVDELAAKLLMWEYDLWSHDAAVGWHDIDAKLGMDRLISDLRFRSMADGTVTPFDAWPTVDNGGQDDEKTRALEAVLGGKVLPRPELEDDVWKLVDEWWAQIAKGDAKTGRGDYLIVLLAGAHGTGKTWGLVRIGHQIAAKYNGVHVCVAATSPPSRPFAFGNLAISKPGPCAILIDDLFPDWSGLVSSITGPLPLPLLILGTAARPADDEDVRRLTNRLGRRAKVVELPDHLNHTAVARLAEARGASLSVTEKSRAKATNFRGVARLLSGSARDHLSSMLGLLSSTQALELLGPLLLCTSLRVPVPKDLLERSVGRSLPSELKPWVLGSRAAAGELLSVEDPDEAASLLTRTLGGARVNRTRDWCERLARNVDPERFAERAFIRHLLRRLARKDRETCQHLLDSCLTTLDLVLAREPLWALIFSWLPILAETGREKLLKRLLANVTAAPSTLAEIAILIEAYGTSVAREHLSTWLTRLSPWNPALLARFVEAVMVLPKDERRATAVKLTSLLVDLPISAFVETLGQRNCFNESITLASDFGLPEDRKAFLSRVGEIIRVRLKSGDTLKQNWFEASLRLTERIISQARFGLGMEIVRQIFIKGHERFNAEEYYKSCFEREQALVHRSIIDLGLTLLRDSDRHPRDSLPPVTGSLVAFAASWAGEDEWLAVADAFIELLESLSTGEISFDRLSATVLPSFAGMRRGPQKRSERFLKVVLTWIPDERRLATAETAKLVLQILGFVALQPWMHERVQGRSREVLLKLVDHCDQVEDTAGALFEALRVAIGMPAIGSQRVRMPHEWIKHHPLAKTYLAQIGRIRWEEQKRIALARQLIRTWQGMTELKQNLTEALLRLGDVAAAKRFAHEMYDAKMAKDVPSYPDPLGYLAVISAKEGDANRGENYVAEAARMQDEHGRGLHPHLAHWVHRELAGVCEGRRRAMHLLCSELAHDRPLRPYDEVVDEARE